MSLARQSLSLSRLLFAFRLHPPRIATSKNINTDQPQLIVVIVIVIVVLETPRRNRLFLLSYLALLQYSL